MDLGTGRGRQGGANGRGKRQRKQACGAGRRDDWQRLENSENQVLVLLLYQPLYDLEELQKYLLQTLK